MSTRHTKPCLSLHRIAYDPQHACFRAEAQYLDLSGIRRTVCHWRGPLTAEFRRIAEGLSQAALAAR